jgi:hypothetical protein
MAVNAPISAPSIPEPNEDTQSLQQAVLAIKQNIEITQGTRFTVNRVTGQTAAQQGVNEALYRFTHP